MAALVLNLGSGESRIDGAISVDLREDVADVVADVRDLPYEDGVVDALFAMDILEHFPADETPHLLAEWRRVLRPGGTLTVRVPNILALAEAILVKRDRPTTVRALIRNIYGGHRWGDDGSLDTHHTGWTPDLLEAELVVAGFNVSSNDHSLNQTIVAVKR